MNNLMPPIQQPYNFTPEQIQKLLSMQDQLNSYIHPDWRNQNFDWNFAIIDECREIKEHLGWKWWKEGYQVGLTAQNQKQVQLEVIDILHFVLSIAQENHTLTKVLAKWFNSSLNCASLDHAVDNNIRCAANLLTTRYDAWSDLARAVGLTEQMILETYVQKYVLNKFRQDHGYKEGTYCKTWKHYNPCPPVGEPSFGVLFLHREDNQVLADLVHELGSDGEDVSDETILYLGLEAAYNSRLNK